MVPTIAIPSQGKALELVRLRERESWNSSRGEGSHLRDVCTLNANGGLEDLSESNSSWLNHACTRMSQTSHTRCLSVADKPKLYRGRDTDQHRIEKRQEGLIHARKPHQKCRVASEQERIGASQAIRLSKECHWDGTVAPRLRIAAGGLQVQLHQMPAVPAETKARNAQTQPQNSALPGCSVGAAGSQARTAVGMHLGQLGTVAEATRADHWNSMACHVRRPPLACSSGQGSAQRRQERKIRRQLK